MYTDKTTNKQLTIFCSAFVELIVRNVHRKSFNVHLFPLLSLLENYFNSPLAENILHSHSFFIEMLSSEVNMFNFDV